MSEIKISKKVTLLIPDIQNVTPENAEEVIKTALTKPDYIENLLQYFEEEYNPNLIVINGLDDEAGYERAKSAKRVLRSARNRTKDICEAQRDEWNKLRQQSLDLQNSTTGRIQKLEDHVDAEIKKIDDEKERIRLVEEAEKKLPLRKNILTNAGIDLPEEQYKMLSDDDFLLLFNTESQKIADKKQQEEAQKKADEEAEKNKIRIQQETLAREKNKLRESRMRTLMFKKNEPDQKFVFILGEETIEASFETVFNSSDEQFDEAATFWEKQIHLAYQKKVDKDALVARQKAIEDVRKEQDEQARKKAEAEANKQAEAKRLADAEAARQAALPDKEKLLAFVKSLDGIKFPEDVVTEKGAKICIYATQLFIAVKEKLLVQINQL